MSAEVVDIHGYLSLCPPERRAEPCVVIVLPVIRVERPWEIVRRERAHRSRPEDFLPSDCEP